MTRAQTAHLKSRFIEHFALMGNVSKACEATGCSRRVIYDWQHKDEEFALAMHEANLMATEVLEAEAWERATAGSEKPVYQNGALVGYVPEKSDTLLIFLLKARAPEKYRERFDHRVTGEITQNVRIAELRQALGIGEASS